MYKYFLIILVLIPSAFSAVIQWDISKGGNFHCYELVASNLSWTQARDAAAASTVVIGNVTYYGHLVTITSSAENEFLRTSLDLSAFPWIGAYQYDKLLEPTGHWAWVTGETYSYTNWNTGEPNNSGSTEEYAHIYNTGYWNDLAVSSSRYFIVEYDVIVPEPTTLVLLGMAGIALALKKKYVSVRS